jgi:DNA-directed RNA polymerase I subunit RPA12
MAAIGSLVFCTDCGNLLPSTKGSDRNVLSCECCGAENKGMSILIVSPRGRHTAHTDFYFFLDTGSKTIVTQSNPSDFPSFLRQKLQSKVQNIDRQNIQTEGTVQETCEKCGREEVKYSNVQLRSADEGSTVIYSCACGNS